jgi:hypothetical protein
MNKALFAVFLIGLGIAAAQTPPDQARQIELQKEAMRKAEAQRIHEAIDQERERLRQSAARSSPIIMGGRR